MLNLNVAIVFLRVRATCVRVIICRGNAPTNSAQVNLTDLRDIYSICRHEYVCTSVRYTFHAVCYQMSAISVSGCRCMPYACVARARWLPHSIDDEFIKCRQLQRVKFFLG